MPTTVLPDPLVKDPSAQRNFDALKQVLGSLDGLFIANGAVTKDDLVAALATVLGVSQTGTVRRGKSIIATEEARTNTAYGTLSTPDQVSSVVLPTDGLITVAYQAMWKESVNAAARAAIFIGANQQTTASETLAAPAVQEAACAKNANVYGPLASGSIGLVGLGAADATVYTGDVTTGQAVGITTPGPLYFYGPCVIFAAAGTYDISVRFKASSGSVTAKNRNLWVKAEGFG